MVRRQRNSAQQIIMKILFGLAPFDAGRTGRRFCSSCSPSGRCRPTRVAISSSDTFDGPPISMVSFTTSSRKSICSDSAATSPRSASSWSALSRSNVRPGFDKGPQIARFIAS